MRQPYLRPVLFMLALVATVTPALGAVTIDPPAGWSALDVSDSPIRLEGAWGAPPTNGFSQNVNFLKQVLPGTSLDAYVALNEKQLNAMDQALVFSLDKREPCGASQMQHVKYVTTFGSRTVAIEQLWP